MVVLAHKVQEERVTRIKAERDGDWWNWDQTAKKPGSDDKGGGEGGRQERLDVETSLL